MLCCPRSPNDKVTEPGPERICDPNGEHGDRWFLPVQRIFPELSFLHWEGSNQQQLLGILLGVCMYRYIWHIMTHNISMNVGQEGGLWRVPVFGKKVKGTLVYPWLVLGLWISHTASLCQFYSHEPPTYCRWLKGSARRVQEELEVF